MGLEGQLGWETWRGGQAFGAVAQVKPHTVASFRLSVWMHWEQKPKSHWERLRNTQPTPESKMKNENICYLPCTIQILVLFSQLKYRRYNPLI